eukprot:4945342-Prymnesium_polylepis.1
MARLFCCPELLHTASVASVSAGVRDPPATVGVHAGSADVGCVTAAPPLHPVLGPVSGAGARGHTRPGGITPLCHPRLCRIARRVISRSTI